jgi:two-component system, sensor histidine kinase and response regulator
MSIYGTMAHSEWRWVEHAGWILFEDVVLVVSCLRTRNDLWITACRTAELENSDINLAGDFLIAADGRILTCNRAFAEILGYRSPEEAIGVNVGTHYAVPEDRERYLAALHERRNLSHYESNLVRTDGVEIRVLENASATFDDHDRIVETRGFLLDITDRRRYEVQLASARDSALQSARTKADFLANMSHEIRTPMNGIVGMADLLLQTTLTADQREFATTIQASADGLLTILNDILDFSKIEAGKLTIESTDFDLDQTIGSSVDLLATGASAKRLELAIDIASEVPRWLSGDAGRLRQILTNLVSNAVKFTDQGEVVVQVRIANETERDVTLRFQVRDTGIGISENAMPRLFQAFSQADSSTTRRYGGTGLGLAICSRLVGLMDGEIGVESELGTGTTFWFTLKFDKRSNAARPDGAVEALRGRHVLVVDDNETHLRILHHQLASWGVTHVAVSSGREALERLQDPSAAGRFDVVILDHQMPEMDGMTTAARIRSGPTSAGVPIILLSSLGRIDADEIRTAGINSRLTKPVRATQLKDALLSVLARQATRVAEPVPGAWPDKNEEETPARARVLVAEDNPVNQLVIRQQLRRLGYAAEIVANGRLAVEQTRDGAFDLVLMDCQMPELDGYEASRQIRSIEGDSRHTPIVAMTANALPGDREKCLEAGMDDYITKPVRLDALERLLALWTAA